MNKYSTDYSVVFKINYDYNLCNTIVFMYLLSYTSTPNI